MREALILVLVACLASGWFVAWLSSDPRALVVQREASFQTPALDLGVTVDNVGTLVLSHPKAKPVRHHVRWSSPTEPSVTCDDPVLGLAARCHLTQ